MSAGLGAGAAVSIFYCFSDCSKIYIFAVLCVMNFVNLKQNYVVKLTVF